ncbi:MAG: hypothetical protein ACTSO2_13145, partial [Promethearchaeota archaeon]
MISKIINDMIKETVKIRKLSTNSLGFVIPNQTANSINLQAGDFISVTITSIIEKKEDLNIPFIK